MSPREDTRRRRAAAVAAAAWAALALAIGVIWHVSDLRATTYAAAQQSLTTGAARAARMVDTWAATGDGDARLLADVAGLGDARKRTATRGTTASATARVLRLQMESMKRVGRYDAIWLLDAHGRSVAAVGDSRMSAAEDSAARLAMITGRPQTGRPERRDSAITIAVARPVTVAGEGPGRATGVVVFRSDLTRAFTQRAISRRPGSPAPVIVLPGDRAGSLVGITLCPAPSLSLCIMSRVDTLARLAAKTPESFGIVTLVDGRRMLVATRRASELPWSAYYAADETMQLAPMYARLRFEGLLLVGVLLVVGLSVYAYDRSAHLRRLSERAQSEARFAAIVNTAMDAIVIVNQDYTIAVMNSAAEAMFGYTAHDSVAGRRSVLELLPNASTDELRRALEQTLRAGEQPLLFAAERYPSGRRRDGTTFPINLSVSRTQIDGRPHLTIVIRDVTDWKRAEEHSEWHRRVLEQIATGVDLREVLDTIARFHETQCPGTECAIHVMDDDGVTLRSASAPSMRPEFVDAMDEIVVGPHAATCGTAVYRRQPIVTADIGTDRLWNDYRALAQEQGYRACWSIPMQSPQGGRHMLGAFAAYVREARIPTPAELRVTETATQLAGIAVGRARAAESLRQSEASFRSFVENSPIGIYRATGTGRLLAVNESLVQLLGYESKAELLEIDMRKSLFMSVSDRERFLRQLEAHGELRSAEMEWRRKDGKTVTVRVSARAYRDERGSVWFAEGFVENVTPLRLAEQALRQSEKLAALGQLVSGVAHELNNPLAAILHFAEDLLDDERTSADLEALTVIRDQARRSRAIVRDLLAFVRFRDAARERVQLTDALAASVRALQPLVEDAGARLTVELPPAEIYGNTDRAGLQQIVTNLVANAAQASGGNAPSGQRGMVWLRATVADDELEIVIEDSGPGIPDALMDRIFEPFFTTKPIGQGTGLGLSVTLGIVQQLGGRISVQNLATTDAGSARSGARFSVRLPIGGAVADEPGAPRLLPMSPESIADPASRPTVLVIDDEPSIRAALRRFFTRRGWHVEDAEDGSEGLARILSSKFDFAVVICDLKMPGCSGIELHDHVAAVAPELLDRMIFSTGDVASREAAEFVRRTRCPVMQKPFELRSLEAVVLRMRQMATA